MTSLAASGGACDLHANAFMPGCSDCETAAAVQELTCGRCGRYHGVCWSAPSDIWNAVMREGVRANVDEFGFCCPNCFMQLADERGVGNTMWVVAPEVFPREDGAAEQARIEATA